VSTVGASGRRSGTVGGVGGVVRRGLPAPAERDRASRRAGRRRRFSTRGAYAQRRGKQLWGARCGDVGAAFGRDGICRRIGRSNRGLRGIGNRSRAAERGAAAGFLSRFPVEDQEVTGRQIEADKIETLFSRSNETHEATALLRASSALFQRGVSMLRALI